MKINYNVFLCISKPSIVIILLKNISLILFNWHNVRIIGY